MGQQLKTKNFLPRIFANERESSVESLSIQQPMANSKLAKRKQTIIRVHPRKSAVSFALRLAGDVVGLALAV